MQNLLTFESLSPTYLECLYLSTGRLDIVPPWIVVLEGTRGMVDFFSSCTHVACSVRGLENIENTMMYCTFVSFLVNR
jgi:hypothetical protein